MNDLSIDVNISDEDIRAAGFVPPKDYMEFDKLVVVFEEVLQENYFRKILTQACEEFSLERITNGTD